VHIAKESISALASCLYLVEKKPFAIRRR